MAITLTITEGQDTYTWTIPDAVAESIRQYRERIVDEVREAGRVTFRPRYANTVQYVAAILRSHIINPAIDTYPPAAPEIAEKAAALQAAQAALEAAKTSVAGTITKKAEVQAK